jgi:photosystem II stability/assembly factor-like uncharacterized protein
MRRSIRVHLTILALGFVVFLLASRSFADPTYTWELSEFQPDIPRGGRTLTIAVHPTDLKQIYVASESGGLFRSTDRGVHWQHVNELPSFRTVSVVYLRADPDIVLATTKDDFRTNSWGGIWRSTDRGYRWVKMPLPEIPKAAAGRFSAYEISVAPRSGEIYVASEYGVLKSTDKGASWIYQDVFGEGNRKVAGVVALDGEHVIAGSVRGLRRTGDGGLTWVSPDTPMVDVRDIHALSRSPISSTQAFAVNNIFIHDERHVPRDYYVPHLNYTEDSGQTWRQIAGTPGGSGGAGGIFFAKAVYRGPEAPVGRAPVFLAMDLFFSDRLNLSKLRIYGDISSKRISFLGPWRRLAVDHLDMCDIAFDNAEYPHPILLATDGGLHKTTDGGASWTFTGGGRNGYNALQVTDVQGQLIRDSGRYDLYFGTWHNSLWASGDDGVTWPNVVGGEGTFIELEKQVSTASASKINFVSCAHCVNYISDPLFTDPINWRNPNRAAGGNPVIVLNKLLHIQAVGDLEPFSRGMASTNSPTGGSWRQYVTFSEDIRLLPRVGKFSSIYGQNDVYLPYREGWSPEGIEVNKLMRITQDYGSITARVVPRPPPSPGRPPLGLPNLGGLGINIREVAPFAIDPGNYLHVIAPDVINNKMVETIDGGNNWHEIPGLTDLVTDSGRLRFSSGISPLVTALSFSPQDPDIVIAGIAEGGLYLSTDNGRNWERIYGSERVAYPTGFTWKNGGDVIIASYGRGLWRLRTTTIVPFSDFGHRCAPLCLISSWDGVSADKVVFDRGLLVYEGKILGAGAANGILKEVFVSNGSSVVFVSENKKDPGIKVTQTNKYVGFSGVSTEPKAPQQAPLMKGLVFDKENRLKGAVFGDKPIMMYEPKEIKEPPRNQNTKSPTEGKPYVRLIIKGYAAEPGETVLVTSPNLQRNTDIAIYVDNEPAAKVRTDGQGNLRAQVSAPVEFARHSLTIRYARDEKNVVDGTMFSVRHKDDAEEEKKNRIPKNPR